MTADYAIGKNDAEACTLSWRLLAPYPACELPETARVPSSHWLDASSTMSDTWIRGKQIPILYPDLAAHLRSRSVNRISLGFSGAPYCLLAINS